MYRESSGAKMVRNWSFNAVSNIAYIFSEDDKGFQWQADFSATGRTIETLKLVRD